MEAVEDDGSEMEVNIGQFEREMEVRKQWKHKNSIELLSRAIQGRNE